MRRLLSIFLIFSSSLAAMPNSREFSMDQYPKNLLVNNRILLKVNGKPISVMDVVKKMDLIFYRQYPELADSVMARYQFYSSGWRTFLGAVIDDYLIMADAEEKKVEVNDGEVREELEKMFGPDVVMNLDQMGMSLDEAFELLKTELIVQRMTGIMVRSKAITEVHPLAVRQRFEKMQAENPPQNYWVYRILSIRGEGHEQVAQEAYRLIGEEQVAFAEVAAQLASEKTELVYSTEYRQSEKDLSLAYKATLQSLTAGTSSAPVTTAKVSRIFSLEKIEQEEPPLFNQVAEEIKKELIQESMARLNDEYRNRLRKHYGMTEKYLSKLIPESLQPFSLR